MLYFVVLLSILLFPAAPARAQGSVYIEGPEVSIGISVPVYPNLVRVPGYPVYYDRRAQSNYFFYDGLYWVYWRDGWYASSWYNGPWRSVGPEHVPLYVLRVPVRYYHQPPPYFRGWHADAPPRWGQHWGHDWERGRAGWDRWDRHAAPPPAPLPSYQRQYSGNRYPHAEDQRRSIHDQHYRYQPHEAISRQHVGGPPDRGHDNRSVQPDRGRDNRPVPQPDRRTDNRPDNRPDNRAVQQDRGHDNRSVQPDRGREGALVRPPDKGRDNRPVQPDRRTDNRAVQQQGRGPDSKPAPSDRGREGALVRPPDKGRESKPQAAPGTGRENKPQAAPGSGRENRPAPQGSGHEKKPAPQGSGREGNQR